MLPPRSSLAISSAAIYEPEVEEAWQKDGDILAFPRGWRVPHLPLVPKDNQPKGTGK